MSHTVYILRNDTNKLYIGQTTDIKKRISHHNSGSGARFTAMNGSFRLVYSEDFKTLQEAMKREKQLKGWSRAKKEALISGDIGILKKL